MKVYNYHQVTKVFLSEELADESPLQPGSFLLPANSVSVPPLPPKSGFDVVWNDSAWEYVEQPSTDTTDADIIRSNERKAKAILQITDWVALPDVELQNKQEWVEYRAAIRVIATNPSVDAVFPDQPQIIWS